MQELLACCYCCYSTVIDVTATVSNCYYYQFSVCSSSSSKPALPVWLKPGTLGGSSDYYYY